MFISSANQRQALNHGRPVNQDAKETVLATHITFPQILWTKMLHLFTLFYQQILTSIRSRQIPQIRGNNFIPWGNLQLKSIDRHREVTLGPGMTINRLSSFVEKHAVHLPFPFLVKSIGLQPKSVFYVGIGLSFPLLGDRSLPSVGIQQFQVV